MGDVTMNAGDGYTEIERVQRRIDRGDLPWDFVAPLLDAMPSVLLEHEASGFWRCSPQYHSSRKPIVTGCAATPGEAIARAWIAWKEGAHA